MPRCTAPRDPGTRGGCTSRIPPPPELLALDARTTDANGAVYDGENDLRGCIPGVHEILRRQGLLEDIWCLDPEETLSPGQSEQIDRIVAAYPELNDDEFVRTNLARWLGDDTAAMQQTGT